MKKKREDETIRLHVVMNKELFFKLKELKLTYRCKTWEEFLKKILEEKRKITVTSLS